MTEEEMDEWLRKAGVASDEGADDEDEDIDDDDERLVMVTSSGEESDRPPTAEGQDEDPIPSTSQSQKLTAIEKVY